MAADPAHASTPPAEAPPSRRRWAGRGMWALADQGFFAGANFLVAVGLAAWLSEHDYGAFTTAYASFLAVGIFTNALLTEPMVVFGSKKYRGRLPQYLGKLVGLHLVLTLAGALVLGAVAAWVWTHSHPLLGQALAALAVIQVSQLLPWMTRVACYIESDPRPAAVSGALYLVVVLGLLGLFYWMGHLRVVEAIFIMGAAGLVANVYLIVKLKVDLREVFKRDGYGSVVGDHWRYGRWVLPTTALRFVPEQLPFIAVPVVLGLLRGGPPDLESGGALKALMNFSIPLVLIGWAVGTLVVPMLVRARGTRRFARLSLGMLGLTAGVPLLLWPLLGGLAEPLIEAVYRGKYVEHASLMWLVAAVPVVVGVDAVVYSQLKAVERPDRLFYASIVSSVVLVAAGLPLLMRLGLTGAVLAILISQVSHVVCSVAISRPILRSASRPGGGSADEERVESADLPPPATREAAPA